MEQRTKSTGETTPKRAHTSLENLNAMENGRRRLGRWRVRDEGELGAGFLFF